MCETMSPSVCSTIELNNQGVAHLHRGHFHDAVRSLSDALMRLKQLLLLDEEDSVHQMSSCQQEATEAIKIDIPSFFGAAGGGFLKKKNQSLFTNASTNTQNFIFRKAFIIPGNVGVGNRRSSNIRYAIICLFNLALSHHLWALDDRLSGCPEGEAGGSRLLASARLYKLAYKLLMQAEDLEMAPVFALAITNNLWQIHNTSEDHAKAELCLEHLLSSLMFFCDRDDIRTQLIDCMDGFISNVMSLLLKDNMTALAA
jgi:hypothetical protein